MGLSCVIGNSAKVLAAKKTLEVGDLTAQFFSQIGYQFEGSYLSAGNFQALVEGLIFINGIEKMFSPSLLC